MLTKEYQNSGNGKDNPIDIFPFSYSEETTMDCFTPLKQRDIGREINRPAIESEVFRKPDKKNISQIITPRNYLSKKNDKNLREALNLIIEASEAVNPLVERSNCFDDWKRTIKEIAFTAYGSDIPHNAIFGILIGSTSGQDVWDFSINSLNAFREATTLLRQSRLLEIDVKRITNILRKEKAIKTWSPDYSYHENDSELDKKFEELKNTLFDHTSE